MTDQHFQTVRPTTFTAPFVPKQYSKPCPLRVQTHPSLYFREEADSKKEAAINILTGGFYARREFVKTSKAGLRCETKRLSINVKTHNGPLLGGGHFAFAKSQRTGLYTVYGHTFHSKLS